LSYDAEIPESTKNVYFTFFKPVGHNDKDYRTMDLIRERTSDTYRVQAEMMTGKDALQFNQAPPQYNIVPQQYNNVQPQQYNNA